MTTPLTLSIAELSDRIAHCLFSLEPYRHLQMAISVSNEGDDVVESVSYELLVPVDSIFNLNGDRWNPNHRHEVNGKLYDVWQTLGGSGGRYSGATGGVTFRGAGPWREKLAVNLKPYDSSVELLWRLFQKGDPIGDYGTATLSLQPFTSRF